MLIPLGILAASGGVPAKPAFDLIQSTTLSVNTRTVAFNNIPQTYRHLQFVATAKVDGGAIVRAQLRINGDNNPSAAAGSLGSFGGAPAGEILTGFESWIRTAQFINAGFSGGIQANWQGTLLDYSLTAKGKSFISREGVAVPTVERVGLGFGYKDLSSAVTSLEFYFDFNSWLSGSTFSLYGIKG